MKVKTRPICHPDRLHIAHRLCRECYSKHRVLIRRMGVSRATCHPDRGVFALGLCTACYFRQRLDLRNAGEGRRATCHPDRPYGAHGMCYMCYNRWWYRSPGGRFYNAREDVRRKRRECTRRWYRRPESQEWKRMYESRPEIRARRRQLARARYREAQGLVPLVVVATDQRHRHLRAGYRTRCRRRAYLKARSRTM